MMTRLTALSLAATLAGCPSSSAPVQPDAPSPALTTSGDAPVARPKSVTLAPAASAKVAAAASDAFALDLYAKLAAGEGNRFFSPASVSIALAMTSAGAAGQTEAELRRVLHLPAEGAHEAFGALQATLLADRGASAELSVANRLWGQRGFGFLDSFLEQTKTYYGAGLERLDFSASEAARATINAWVSEQTKGKIPQLLPPRVINASTRLVLTNAVYFLGKWRDAFDPKATQPAPFHKADGGEVRAALMHRRGRYGYAEDDEVQVLTLPYKDADLSMVVVLPRAPTGLPAVEAQLKDKLAGWIAAAHEPKKVDVTLPIFTLRAKASLVEPLQSLGMKSAFGGGADFSRMDGERDLFISAIVHEAYVKVSEEGTEAAGATAVVVSRSLAPRDPPPAFVADHPFFFAIRDERSGALLFMGRLTDPSAGS